MNSRSSYFLTVLEQDLDTFGHVNNTIFLQYFEKARWQICTEQGYGLKEVHDTGVGPVILELNVKFKKELKLRDQICIESEVLSYGRAVAYYQQQLFKVNPQEEKELCADALFTFALFDLKARRIVPPTEKWIRAIGLDPTKLSKA